jgi:hypothetical protein
MCVNVRQAPSWRGIGIGENVMSRSLIDRLMRRVDALEAQRRELMAFLREARRCARHAIGAE